MRLARCALLCMLIAPAHALAQGEEPACPFLWMPDGMPDETSARSAFRIRSVVADAHVAAAFSAAFALRLGAPERRSLAGALLAIAVVVWMNTVYGRYHYAADGLAGFAVSRAATGILLAYKTRAAQR